MMLSLFLSIELEYFVDPDTMNSNIELGTREHPFRAIDDPFRELFNREHYFMPDGTEINATIFLKSSGISDEKETSISRSNHTIYSM